jgi:hypothetical protein
MLLVVLAAGCRSSFAVPEPAPPPDLASTIYFCPPEEPANGTYACEPAAIPTCSYPALELTCSCLPSPDGGHALYCPVEDGGTSG